MRCLHPDTVLAAILLAFAAGLLLFWLPAVTDTGLYEIKRGKFTIGDALAPAFAATVMTVAGLLLLFGPRSRDEPKLDPDHVKFLSAMIAIVLAGMVLMRWAGPTATTLFADDEYRLLRDTVPWKYVGFPRAGSSSLLPLPRWSRAVSAEVPRLPESWLWCSSSPSMTCPSTTCSCHRTATYDDGA